MKTIRFFFCVLLLMVASTVKAQSLNTAKQLLSQEKYVEAAKQLRPLANNGNAEAQYLAATLFFEGKGVNKDATQAEKYARLAIQQGYADAFHLLNNYYSLNLAGDEQIEKSKGIIALFMQKNPNYLSEYLFNGGEDANLLSTYLAEYYIKNVFPIPTMKKPAWDGEGNFDIASCRVNRPMILAWQNGLCENQKWVDMVQKAKKKTTPIAYQYFVFSIAQNIYHQGVDYGPAYLTKLLTDLRLIVLFAKATDEYPYKLIKEQTTGIPGDQVRPGELVFAEPEKSRNKRTVSMFKEQSVSLSYPQIDNYLKEKLNQNIRWRLPSSDDLETVVRVLWATGHEVEGTYWSADGIACRFDADGYLEESYKENPQMIWKCIFVNN